MVVGEGAKRRMKFEIVEVHFNFTSHDFVYFRKLVIDSNFSAHLRLITKHNDDDYDDSNASDATPR
jgi:hypothetical protein